MSDNCGLDVGLEAILCRSKMDNLISSRLSFLFLPLTFPFPIREVSSRPEDHLQWIQIAWVGPVSNALSDNST